MPALLPLSTWFATAEDGFSAVFSAVFPGGPAAQPWSSETYPDTAAGKFGELIGLDGPAYGYVVVRSDIDIGASQATVKALLQGAYGQFPYMGADPRCINWDLETHFCQIDFIPNWYYPTSIPAFNTWPIGYPSEYAIANQIIVSDFTASVDAAATSYRVYMFQKLPNA